MSGTEKSGARWMGSVRALERDRFVFFALLGAGLGAAQGVGITVSEALFLVRVGPAALPAVFAAGAGVSLLGTLVYAIAVGRARNDRLFVWMLLVAATGLVALGLAVGGPWWIPGALLCASFAIDAVFANHFWTFATDYFDARASVRVFPALVAAQSAGAAFGGALAWLLARLAGLDVIAFVWAGLLCVTAIGVRIARRRLRRWGPLDLEEEDAASVDGLRGAVRFVARSPLARALALAVLGMVGALFVAQAIYSTLFVRAFPSERELAGFIGAYLAVASVAELIVVLVVTPRVIARLGVARANEVHAGLTLASFAALALLPGLASGIAARASAELGADAVAEPVRALIYNALPYRLRGRVRAFLEGVVVYAGMAIAAIAMLSLPEEAGLASLVGLGAALAVLYVFASARVRRAYGGSLVEGLRHGRLDLDDVGPEVARLGSARLGELWRGLIASSPSAQDLELAEVLADRGELRPLFEGVASEDPRVRRAAVYALRARPEPEAAVACRNALGDPDAAVRLAALARGDGGEVVRARLDDPDARVRVAAAHVLSDEHALASFARDGDPALAVAALEALPDTLTYVGLERIDAEDADVRAAALACVARAPGHAPLDPLSLTAELDHPSARVRRAAVEALLDQASLDARAGLARALADSAVEVRTAAQRAFGSLGDEGLEALLDWLAGRRDYHAQASAILALARIGSARAHAALTTRLKTWLDEAWRAELARRALLASVEPAHRYARLALADAVARRHRLCFLALAQLEDERVIATVERVLRVGARRARADAIEVLENLGERATGRRLALLCERASIEEVRTALSHLGPLPLDPSAALVWAADIDDPWIARALTATHDTKRGIQDDAPMMDRLLLLRQVPLFAHLNLDQLEAINRLLSEERYVAGEVIFREGDLGDRLFVLAEGEVRIYRDYRGPSEVLLSVQRPVTCVGEMGVLDDAPRSATLLAASESRLLALDGVRLKELVLQMPEMAFDFFRVLTERVRLADSRFQDVVAGERAEGAA